MCGLASFHPIDDITAEQQKTAFAKMKILGLYNKSRGKHSCGFYIDSTINKGIGHKKEFDDFIQNTMLVPPKEIGAMLIHTRHATVGAHDEKNAHPFLIEGDPSIVFMHNGTIKNIRKLCLKYGVDHSYTKVDSLHLGEIIQKSKNLDVLNEYIGTAALIWTDFTHENVSYVYHGKSIQVTGVPVEERPLFFLQTDEGLYFSSIEDSLDAICDADWHQVEKLEFNKVFQIMNGTFTAYNIDVTRTTEQEATGYYGRDYYLDEDYGYGDGVWPNTGQNSRVRSHSRGINPPSAKNPVHSSPSTPASLFILESMVWREAFPDHAICTEDKIFFWRGRYVDCKKKLLQGVYYLRNRGYVGTKDTIGATVYYFFRGAMLRNYTDYNVLTTLNTRADSWIHNDTANFAKQLSLHTIHPVTNLDDESSEIASTPRYSWYAGGETCRCAFTPKFAGRHYKINEIGELTDIVNSGGKGGVVIYKTLSEAIKADGDTEGGDDDGECPMDCGIVAMRDVEDAPINVNSTFDVIFDNIHDVMETIQEEEYNALLLFLSDNNEVDRNGNYIDMSTYLNSRISAGCIVGQSLREVVGDRGYRLETYLDQVKDRKETLEAMSVEAQFTEVVEALLELESLGDELQSNTDNDTAQDICYSVYKNLGPLKEELISIASKCEFDSLLKKLENSKKNA